jgi:SPP1 gp7 family putative phage head morphogenesis protein
MNESAKINAMLADTREIERLGIQQSRQALVKLRQRVIAAYREQAIFNADFLVKELQPTLEKAAAIAHASGQRRALLLAKQGATKEQQRRLVLSHGNLPIEFDLLDKVAKLLKKTYSGSIDSLKKLYTDVVSTALKNLAAPIERKVRDTINDLIGETAPLNRAIEKLDETLNRLGVGTVEENKLEAIYRTQLQTSFNAGRWQEDQDEAIQEILWGYKYVTAGDDRVREEHAALDGTTLPKDDPFWETYWPPNGWNCRCQVIPIFEERETKQPELLEDGSVPRPDAGFEFNPGIVLTDVALSLGYDPNQPRDEKGRFGETDGGSSVTKPDNVKRIDLESIDSEVAQKIMDTVTEVTEQYPINIEAVQSGNLSGQHTWEPGRPDLDGSVAQLNTLSIGKYKDGEKVEERLHYLNVEEKIFANREAYKTYRESVPSGFLAEPSIKGTIVHEIGHALEKDHPQDLPQMQKIYSKYKESGGNLSTYSKANMREMVAEAFAHNYIQGSLEGTGLEELKPIFDSWKKRK